MTNKLDSWVRIGLTVVALFAGAAIVWGVTKERLETVRCQVADHETRMRSIEGDIRDIKKDIGFIKDSQGETKKDIREIKEAVK